MIKCKWAFNINMQKKHTILQERLKYLFQTCVLLLFEVSEDCAADRYEQD